MASSSSQAASAPCAVARVPLHVADLAEAHRHGALPLDIQRIGRDQRAPDGEALLVGLERAGAVARIELEVGDAVEIDGDVLLRDLLGPHRPPRARGLWRGLPRRRQARLGSSPCARFTSPRRIRLTETSRSGPRWRRRFRRARCRMAWLSSALLLRRREIARRKIGLGELVEHDRLARASGRGLSGSVLVSRSTVLRTWPRILSRLSTLMPSTLRRPWAMLKMRPFTVSSAAAKLRSARSAWTAGDDAGGDCADGQQRACTPAALTARLQRAASAGGPPATAGPLWACRGWRRRSRRRDRGSGYLAGRRRRDRR